MNSTAKKIGLVSIEKVEASQAARICHSIAATLPEWFGIPEANKLLADLARQ